MGERAAPYRYRLFGLDLSSELRLPELTPVESLDLRRADVTIRLGEVASLQAAPPTSGPPFEVHDGEVRLEIHDTARFSVRDGRQIVVMPAPGAAPRRVRAFLHGWALGALCHQRGWLPLHASAIEVDGTCVAFCGTSRAGKSTLAANLRQRGYRVLSDDVCVVHFDASGRPVAFPAPAGLKLWRDAIEALDEASDTLERVVDGFEKYHVDTPDGGDAAPVPMRCVYVLNDSPGQAPESFVSLRGVAAVEALLVHTHRSRLLAPMGRTAEHFKLATSVAGQLTVWSMCRQRGFDILSAQVARLEEHFRQDTRQG